VRERLGALLAAAVAAVVAAVVAVVFAAVVAAAVGRVFLVMYWLSSELLLGIADFKINIWG
jgi:hypothetical protein